MINLSKKKKKLKKIIKIKKPIKIFQMSTIDINKEISQQKMNSPYENLQNSNISLQQPNHPQYQTMLILNPTKKIQKNKNLEQKINKKQQTQQKSTAQKQKQQTKKQQPKKKVILRSDKLKIKNDFNTITTNSRTIKAQEDLLKHKHSLFEAYKALKKNIIDKKIWRAEIVSEIFEFTTLAKKKQMRKTLQAKEEELRSSLFLMNKQNPLTLQQTWSYLLIDPTKKLQFQQAIQNNKMETLPSFGTIVEEGQGENPSKQIIQKIKKQFMLFEFEPMYCLKKEGLKLLNSGKNNEAIEIFTEYLENYNQTNKFSLMKRGQCYINIQEWDLALQDFNLCNSINPNNFKGILNVGWIYLQKGQYLKAIENLEQAYTIYKNEIDTLLYLALSYIQLNNYPQALLAGLQALKINPKNIFAQNVINKIKVELNNNNKFYMLYEECRGKEYEIQLFTPTSQIELE